MGVDLGLSKLPLLSTAPVQGSRVVRWAAQGCAVLCCESWEWRASSKWGGRMLVEE